MNVCVICQGDGVAEVLGSWYCTNHIEEGFLELAIFLSNARGWDPDETVNAMIEWFES